MKKAKQQKQTTDSTPMAVTLANLCRAGALYCGEIIYDNIGSEVCADPKESAFR